MAPPSTSTGAGENSPWRPSLAGAAESSSTRPDDALGSVLGAAPRSTADAPEAAPGADSAEPQPQGSVSSSGVPSDGTCSAANAPEASFVAPGAARFSSVRWEDIEDIVTAGTDRTVRQVQGSTQSQFLALVRLVVDLNRRPPLRIDYELDQRLEAAGSLSDAVGALAPTPRSAAPWEYEFTELRDDVASLEARLVASEASLHRESSQAAAALEQRCRRLNKSLADTHKVIRHDREQFQAGISSYAAQLRQLREYLEQSDRQSSASGGANSASASAMPAAFATFLEELGALQLAIPPPPAPSGSSEGSGPTPPASSGASSEIVRQASVCASTAQEEAAAWSAFSGFEGSESCEGSNFCGGQQQWAFSERSFIAPGCPSSDLVGADLRHSGLGGKWRVVVRVHSKRVGSAVFTDPSDPSVVDASTASLPSTPVVSRGITPGTEASVPVEIDDDGGFGADGAASEASVAPGECSRRRWSPSLGVMVDPLARRRLLLGFGLWLQPRPRLHLTLWCWA
ncbi:unnamed protein product [Phytophthora fragariaefolia]|uniref:Unnamed protein product n=1 Tax=Phytophthora fragariaefolia TaxID=1490495 RepID=A0A9W6X8I6_9STRA|nr:unnamed protein product [Phytophthora fragariaefolia]